MTKAKELLLAVLDSVNEGWNLVDMPDARQHVEHSFIGASVQGSIQRSNGTCRSVGPILVRRQI